MGGGGCGTGGGFNTIVLNAEGVSSWAAVGIPAEHKSKIKGTTKRAWLDILLEAEKTKEESSRSKKCGKQSVIIWPALDSSALPEFEQEPPVRPVIAKT